MVRVSDLVLNVVALRKVKPGNRDPSLDEAVQRRLNQDPGHNRVVWHFGGLLDVVGEWHHGEIIEQSQDHNVDEVNLAARDKHHAGEEHNELNGGRKPICHIRFDTTEDLA